MKHPRIRRIVGILLTLVLLLAVFPATPALAAKVIDAAPNQGKVGDLVDVYGADFPASLQVTIYFSSDVATTGYTIDGQVNAYEKVATVNTTLAGEFNTSFNVPSVLNDGSVTKTVDGGTYYVIATYVTNEIRAVDTYTVTVVASATISPSSGVVGDSVIVSGAAFGSGLPITVTLDGAQVATVTSDSNGGFSTSFILADNSAGGHQLTVSDGTTTKTQTFTVSPRASFSPASGLVGTEVTIGGTGFGASATISLTFDGIELATASSDTKGSFSAVVTITDHAYGSYQLITSDGTNQDTGSFTIFPSAAISPANGFVGTEVTISGTGFAASKSLPVLFAGDLVHTAATNANGSFSGSFVVPSRDAGSYSIEVSNDGNLIKADSDFLISTSAVINPSTSVDAPGHLGSQLTINGVGFTTGRTVAITYDGAEVAATTVKPDGTFQATFTVTAGNSGEHTIIATDVINTSRFSFFMEATPPPLPSPLKPEMGIEAEAETIFDWQDVTDPSGVTYLLQIATAEDFSLASIVLEKKGLTRSEYTITEMESLKTLENDAPYYWRVRAIDGASNQSPWSDTGIFLIKGFSLSMPQPLLYTLLGVGALLLFLAGIWLGRKTAYY